jgi:hypothetical protein
MKNLIKELPLPNGLSVSFFDHTCQYFGGIYRVKLEISCRMPVVHHFFADPQDFVQAQSFFGDELVYTRIKERMGVPSHEIESVLQSLIANFIEHSLPYFGSDMFPGKMMLSEIRNMKKKGLYRISGSACEK